MITLKLEGAPELQARLDAAGSLAPTAFARAVNRVASMIKTATLKELAAETELAQKDIRPGTTLFRAKVSSLFATIRVSGQRIPLIAFRARQTRAGVTYKLRHGRGLAPSSFFATMSSGHRGVFKRTGKFGRRENPRLERIAELFGPSLPGAVIRQRIFETQARLGGALLRDRLAHELDFLVQQGKLAPDTGEPTA